MVSKAVQAAEIREKEKISVRVVNVSSLKPTNENGIKKFASDVKGIITAEEHSLIGGLASIITYILRGNRIQIQTIGILPAKVAQLSGAGEIVVIGTNGDDKRLELPKDFGATIIINSSKENPLKKMGSLQPYLGCMGKVPCTNGNIND